MNERCPNHHPRTWLRAAGERLVGARFYCLDCAHKLLSAFPSLDAFYIPRGYKLCANPRHDEHCCRVSA
jgi:hypothetical protein